jgi:pimeloyl-ACP methyl ester carboxylesterase
MTRLLLLPGVGADGRLFEAQRSCAADVDVIEWIEPATRDESLGQYASRLAATIDTARPFVIGGASFGGMVALELARHVRPLAVILVASCRSPSLLPRHYRPLITFAQLLPAAALTSAPARCRLVTSRFGLRTRQERQLFADMLRETPPAFVQWACRAIFGWPGATDLDLPVHHIHGAGDRIIPLRSVRPDVVVPGAGHLLNVTHRAEVNAFIDDVCSPTR